MPDSPPGPRAAPPSRPKPPAARRRTALLLTMILAVLAAVLLVVFVLRLARQPGGKVNLGAQEFDLGKDTDFAPKVTLHGPLIFPPLRGSIAIYVQHLGTDPAHGWLAFGAHDPGQPPNCLVVWRPATHDFFDACNRAVFPEDGTGLDQYATRVAAGGDVIINLRQSTGTTPAATSTTVTKTTTANTPTTTTRGTSTTSIASAPPASP